MFNRFTNGFYFQDFYARTGKFLSANVYVFNSDEGTFTNLYNQPWDMSVKAVPTGTTALSIGVSPLIDESFTSDLLFFQSIQIHWLTKEMCGFSEQLVNI